LTVEEQQTAPNVPTRIAANSVQEQPMFRIPLLASLAALLFPSAPMRAQERVIGARSEDLKLETLVRGLEHPWSLAFLPDGGMLVTERPGRLRAINSNGRISRPLRGVPAVFAEGQGGLLDIVLDPNFESNRLLYLSYAEPGPGGASTAVARGRLADGTLEDMRVIFRQMPKVHGPNHFGGRLVFAPDGTLFVTLGERFKFEPAQDLSNHLGKIVRINPDGSVPADNPFVGRAGAKAEIWSYGHRNIEGAVLHPATGVLWIHEMGPLGGDELNIPRPGRNYGWPLVSWGRHYDGEDIPDPSTRPDLAGSVHQWTPVISPSGMAFYTGDMLPQWNGNLLIGGLSSRGIVRVMLDGDEFVGEKRLSLRARIRDVRQGPDGAVYALTDEDDGKLLRITPRSAPTVGSGRR
jgi:glucose/arabinose dehydrogenase